MLRKDRVYQSLKNLCENIPVSNSGDYKNIGYTAKEVAEFTGITRANASSDLNALTKEKKILKIPGRPVKFLDNSWKFDENGKLISCSKNTNSNGTKPNISLQVETDPFLTLVGYDGSLKNVCEQAKAAVLYPPHGLHTLIIGESGTGKTLLANLMHKFSLHKERLVEGSPFISLNCSDYSHNSQLLVSLLFGHEKGTFTGADKSKEGLVKQAEGGILFLDEIHRLSPEGQEMLFSLMDKGTYRKLGSDKEEKISNVLLIGATTEDPYSTLLTTFMRRIPMLIKMPSLSERPIVERIQLIKELVLIEANRLNVPINIYSGVVKYFLNSVQFGNIGRLKSMVQYSCAKAFLNYTINKEEYVTIDPTCLPEGSKVNHSAKQSASDGIYITPRSFDDSLLINSKSPLSTNEWYKNLNAEIENLIDIGYTEDQAIISLSEKLDNKFKGLSASLFKSQREKLLSIVPHQVLIISERLMDLLDESSIKITPHLNGALTLYIGQLYQRLINDRGVNFSSTFNFDESKIPQYEKLLSKKLIEEITKMIGKNIPAVETDLLASLIHSLKIAKSDDSRITIIILAHGENSATSIGSVVNKILGEEVVYGFNVNLNENIENFFNKVLRFCLRVKNDNGILFLVDMGSLMKFGERISTITGIKTCTIGSVSTPKVLEAVSKHFISNDLEQIALSVIENDKLYFSNFKALYGEFNNDVQPIKLDFALTLPSILTYYTDFLDPDELALKFSECITTIQNELTIDLPDNIVLIFIAHLARLLERILIGDSFKTPIGDLNVKDNHKLYYLTVKNSLSSIENFYNIKLPENEICFLTEIILSNR